jgi:phosphoglycerate dehydrogenase-like enzyme
MSKTVILVVHWLPDGELIRWSKEFPDIEFVDARVAEARQQHLPRSVISYGLPDVQRLGEASQLRWIQLASAGVPWPLCQPARQANIRVTNLAGLYGPSIAEHAIGMLLFLSRNLHIAHNNQKQGRWDQTVAATMRDLHGKTLAVVG